MKDDYYDEDAPKGKVKKNPVRVMKASKVIAQKASPKKTTVVMKKKPSRSGSVRGG